MKRRSFHSTSSDSATSLALPRYASIRIPAKGVHPSLRLGTSLREPAGPPFRPDTHVAVVLAHVSCARLVGVLLAASASFLCRNHVRFAQWPKKVYLIVDLECNTLIFLFHQTQLRNRLFFFFYHRNRSNTRIPVVFSLSSCSSTTSISRSFTVSEVLQVCVPFAGMRMRVRDSSTRRRRANRARRAAFGACQCSRSGKSVVP